jgi:branched-chain amino acid transport system permease protein
LEFSLLLTFGFIAAVIGGLESLPGAVLGAFILGLVLAITQIYISGTLVLYCCLCLASLSSFDSPGCHWRKVGRRA